MLDDLIDSSWTSSVLSLRNFFGEVIKLGRSYEHEHPMLKYIVNVESFSENIVSVTDGTEARKT